MLVVGAGPAGAAAATWLARGGSDVLLLDAQDFPRDKPCGDGLTPRAIAELDALGLTPWTLGQARNWGLRAAGFGEVLYLPWPGGTLPRFGGAARRTVLDAAIRDAALDAGAKALTGRAVGFDHTGSAVRSVTVQNAGGRGTITCQRLIVADGARSQLGRLLGRQWHRGTAYGVAARGYLPSGRSDDPWISSHLELRDAAGEVLSGYGWVFPLADGSVNIGVGTLATERHPADVNLRRLLAHYADTQRRDWQLAGVVQQPWSALLPMGGAVSGVAGANWLLIGDAAGCVNPLNGEGIDYGLETGRLAAQLLLAGDVTAAWPDLLREHYGTAFSIARRLAGLLTVPGLLPTAGPWGMRSRSLMKVALRLMGNLVTDADTDAVARAWRVAGRASVRLDERPPWAP
ncbi:MAG: Geranylgeranyl reductase family protein [Actinomycetota bacterium]|nr:Geranylgeranyl reductase family protein [Actinomycetota bacterium]